MERNGFVFFVVLVVILLLDAGLSFQVDDIHYVLIRRKLKSKKCRHGLTDGPNKLYSETYTKLFECVTLPSLVPGEIASKTIKVYQSDNGTDYYTVKSCPNLKSCEGSSHFDNFSVNLCTEKQYQENKCESEEDEYGTYTIISKYRTSWTPAGIFYLPHNYNGVMTGLYSDGSCKTRIGYHFEVDQSFTYNGSKIHHESCFVESIKDSKKCKPVDESNGKTFMKQVCLRSGPFRLEWIWFGLSLIILFTLSCCFGFCPCVCAVCDREAVKKKVTPEWQRTYSFIHEDDETLDAERISINRLKGDMNVKVKRCVLVVRKLMELWHFLTIGIIMLTSIFTVITFLGTVTIWVFMKYPDVELIVVSTVMLVEFLLVCPSICISCYWLCPTELSDNWQISYCGQIASSAIFNIYFFVFLVLNMYYFFYAGILFGNGMVYFETHVWVYTAVFFVKSVSFLFIMVEIMIRVVKILLGLKGIIECISSNVIGFSRLIGKMCRKIGILKPRDANYQPI